MDRQSLDFSQRIEINKEQRRDRVIPDEQLVHFHWTSERALVAFIPPTARTILDLGCGPTSGMLMPVPDLVYVGLDFVHEYLGKLRREHSIQGPWEFATRHWTTSSMESLPFSKESFDVVYSRHALEHSPDLLSTLSEIKRVLRPGGIFCLLCAGSDR